MCRICRMQCVGLAVSKFCEQCNQCNQISNSTVRDRKFFSVSFTWTPLSANAQFHTLWWQFANIRSLQSNCLRTLRGLFDIHLKDNTSNTQYIQYMDTVVCNLKSSFLKSCYWLNIFTKKNIFFLSWMFTF